MIEQILDESCALPFYFEQRDSVIISDSPVVMDLLFMEEINGLVLKGFSTLLKDPIIAQKTYVEVLSSHDFDKFHDFNMSDDFIDILKELVGELKSTMLGVQVTKPELEMCPSFHIDKLSLRLVQCLDGKGTILQTHDGSLIETNKGDLIFLKGEMWKSKAGALRHRSPDSDQARRLLRIDFLD